MKKLAFLLLSILNLWAMPTGTYGDCKESGPETTRVKIIERDIVVNGRHATVYDLTPTILEKTEGECFNVIVENHTSVPTSLHWHGLIDPVLEDGVAYVTQPPIQPGKSHPYNFEVVQAGTFWTHSHFGLQEQLLMAAPLILLPKEKLEHRDVILIFEGFTFRTIEQVWLGLRDDYMKVVQDKGQGWMPNLVMTKNPHAPEDLNDVDFDAFLTNRTTLEDPMIFQVKAGETIRLRLINGSVGSGFHITLGELKGQIIAVDGSDVIPINFSHFPIATAQRVDVLVTIPQEGGVFPILAQCQGTSMRTGALLATPNASIPKLSSTTKTTASAITNSIEKSLHAKTPLKKRKVDRKLQMDLVGNMKYYVWGINNHVWPNNEPLFVEEGERVELTFTNKTSMAHPMHLHGHVFQVVEIDGDSFDGALRDTILVMPFQTVKVLFDANNPGIWAAHCHISYHLWAGMFTVVQYKDYKPPYFSKQSIVDYSRIYGGY